MLTEQQKKLTPTEQKKRMIMISAILSFILMLIGAATLVLIQKPIQESQDLRQQASVTDGVVDMSFAPTTGSNLEVGQPANIDFKVDTGGVQITGIQLMFNIVTDTLSTPPEFILADPTNTALLQPEFEQTQDGYLASFTLLSNPPLNPLSFNGPTSIGQLRFTPASEGTIEINFDVENSLSAVYEVNPPEDELTHIATLNYTVGSVTPTPTMSATPTPTATPINSGTPTPTPIGSSTPTPTPTQIAQATPTPTVQATPTPTPDDGSGTGGLQSCNESCSSNSQCEANHRCYNGRCRLVTNVSSSSCQAASTPDNGLNRTCNQYCADSRECASGYSCHFNRCRNPLNLDSTSCAAPSQQVASAMAASCNQRCSSHKDCAANLLCYGPSGTCRLATNPGSASCSPAQAKTVSPSYSTPQNNTSKGGTGASTPGATSSTGTGSQATATPVSGSTNTSSPRATSRPSSSPMVSIDSDEEASNSAFAYLQNQLKERGISMPLFFIGLGLLLLLVVIILSFLGRTLRGASQPPRIVPVAKRRDEQKDSQYEQQLASKINTLQHPPVTPTAPPTVPTTSVPPAPGQTSGSSMMDRLQQRGVKPPQT